VRGGEGRGGGGAGMGREDSPAEEGIPGAVATGRGRARCGCAGLMDLYWVL
jgi:hypothetical protein